MSEWFHVGQKAAAVAGYEGLYSVTDDGQVFSHYSYRFLRANKLSNGYLVVALHRNGIQRTRSIHRLVAAAFCTNPDRKPSVNHINGDREDNRAVNLEWCTAKENTRNGMERGTITGVARRVPEEVRVQIRATYRTGGISLRRLAAQHGLTKNAIRYMLAEDKAMLSPKKQEVEA